MPKPASSGPRIIFYDTTPTELAWAAGFLDGEGTIRFRPEKTAPDGKPRGYGIFQIQAAQVDREVLDRLQRAMGGIGKVYGPYISKQANRKPYHAYAAGGITAVEAFRRLLPYLSSVKRAQGDAALATHNEYVNRPKFTPGRKPGSKVVRAPDGKMRVVLA